MDKGESGPFKGPVWGPEEPYRYSPAFSLVTLSILCLTSLYEVQQFENLIGSGEYHTFMERQATIALLRRYVHGDALIKHCLATGAVMKAVAGFFPQDPARWEEIGILHDIDFE